MISPSDVLLGTSTNNNVRTGQSEKVSATGAFTLASESELQLQTYGTLSRTATGLGKPNEIVEYGDNIYATLVLEKIG
jgi:hypothetical protein